LYLRKVYAWNRMWLTVIWWNRDYGILIIIKLIIVFGLSNCIK
jgi:hypothetical protein